jgi:5-methylcytosine-specific restriction endonuclease McrA
MSLRLAPELYAELKLVVLKRDGWKCRFCKIRNNLHVHHIVFRSEQGPDQTWNLVTLCSSCHEAVHDFRLTMWSPNENVGADGVLQFFTAMGWRPRS